MSVLSLEVTWVENRRAHAGEHSVADFVDYIAKVNAQFTGVNAGWSAWYDRHLGVMFEHCPLDDYMATFAAQNVSFNPHGRPGAIQNADISRDHVWTEGVQGYGLEMQGNFSYTFADCYPVFNWCSWDTVPTKNVCDEE